MKNLFSSRLLVLAVVIFVSVLLLGQSMGIAGSTASSEASNADAALAASSSPQMDWALAALVIGGTLITLLRPKRRRVVNVTK